MRQFLGFLAAGLLAFSACVTAQKQKEPCAAAGTSNDFLGIQTIRLWPGDAPEARGTACEDIPTLSVFEPLGGEGSGSAVIILPSGGYSQLTGRAGRIAADWFAARGFRAFVLSYRLSGSGYLMPVPLLDARRAVQLVRARARDYQIDPHRIVVAGFSAGGHLAALAATQFIAGKPAAEDPIDRVSSRPDYLVLGYAWIGALESKTGYCELFKTNDGCAALRAAYSPDLFVTRDTPATFIYHTFNDEAVGVEQGLRFYEALVKAGVPSELHIFPNGAHGSGLGKGDVALDQWPNLMETWLRAQGLLGKQ